MQEVYATHSPGQTMELGNKLSEKLSRGSIVCLYGDLGAGKTQFVKGISEGLGINPNLVNSPTFTLINEYTTGTLPVYHFDCYRIKNEREALDIGIEEYLYGDGVCVIEWPEHIESLLPDSSIRIVLSKTSENSRAFTIQFP